MASFPEGCRVIWLHERSLPYRSKPEFDEDDLYATRVLRVELGEHLRLFCQELSALMKWFVENLRRIHRDVDWIRRETEKIWPLLDNEYPTWIQFACFRQSAEQNWQAPGWLDKWPEELAPEALLSASRGGRLDADRTTGVLRVIGNRIKERLASEQRSVLDRLVVRVAQEKEAAANAAPENAREPTAPQGATSDKTKSGMPAGRLMATIQSPTAARRMEAYLRCCGIGQTEFANRVGTTDRTLRTFRKTGKVRRDIFEAIAKAMGTTKEALLKE